ncbi:hypothetical protein [Celeribacter marinus]|nr:hypothetical protein [Celeribacter marinus]SFK99290.1 hypothetical protein SAMN05444421_11265 [Celeribacter marinus]
MAKRDKKGSPQNGGDHFTKMIRATMETPAWRALSFTAQAAYPWLKLEWRGPRANNNGKISLSVRQLADRMGANPNTAAKALHDLQAKGFIVVTRHAVLGSSGHARSAEFELTELALSHSDQNGGRKLFKEWCEGGDYSVANTPAHNPNGANGKTKPCLKKQDGTVLKNKTNRN